MDCFLRLGFVLDLLGVIVHACFGWVVGRRVVDWCLL